MTTIYRHEAPKTDCYDTRRIVVDQLYDGSTDITTIVGECGKPAAFMNHNLSIAESDKLGAVLCKDIIDNYREHNDHLKQRYEDSKTTIRDGINEHNKHTHQLYARIEYLEAINKGHDDCKEAVFKLLDQRSELEATIRGLEQDIANLRISNALYKKRWNEHENESNPSESRGTEYGIRARNFLRLMKGCHGMLSRNGKTITITLPFENESVARNAEKFIVGLED